MPDQQEPSKQPERRSRPLTGKERFFAVVFGSLFGVTGSIAMFLTENEAGTAVSLLLSGVLILAGVQGTQVLKLTKEGGELARREFVSEKAREVAEERPEVARGILDGYGIADPGARTDPVIVEALGNIEASLEYQRKLAPLLRDVAGGNAAVGMSPRQGIGADISIFDKTGKITVETVHAPRRTLRAEDVESARRRAERVGADAVLLVTNALMRRQDVVPAINAPGIPVEVVKWTIEEGAQAITTAANELRKRISQPDS